MNITKSSSKLLELVLPTILLVAVVLVESAIILIIAAYFVFVSFLNRKFSSKIMMRDNIISGSGEIFEKIKIRNYEGTENDKVGVEDLERKCSVGPTEHVFLFTDTMGDPICRIRNSPMYNMLVAELNKEIVGVIQGSIKIVTFHKPPKNLSKVGYILGLRVDPIHRRKGIGFRLVHQMEEWFNSNQVDYSYMATEKGNEASVNLFINKLGYVKFRTPAILVHPAVMESTPRWQQQQRRRSMMEKKKKNIIEIVKLKVEEAEFLYRNYMMNSTEFFPNDMDKILRNKLSLGTWVAYNRNNDLSGEFFGPDGMVPKNWAMISVWNSGEIFKLRIGKGNNKPPFSCILYSKSSRIINKAFPCFKNRASSSAILLPDDFLSSNSSSSSNPFGFYFMYGLYRDGPFSGKLIRALCKFIHNLAAQDKDCKAVVTEVGGFDPIKLHIPHWKLLSCTEDLWCIKALKQDERKTLFEFTKNTTIRTLFVDPREV